MSEYTSKTAVIGLGCAGIRMLNALAMLPAANKLFMLAVDTDAAALAACKLPESHQILADVQWQQGKGCGGDPQKGQRSIAREREKMEKLIVGFDYLIILGGLGGGLATGAVEPLSTLSSKLKIPTIHLLTLPFSWEGHAKRKKADAAIAELMPVADSLLALPNDLLFSVLLPETPAEEAFKLADNEMARAVIAITEILNCQNLIPSDFSDFQTVLKSRKSYCAIGVGVANTAESANPGQLAVDRMLTAPLLGGIGKLKEADVVLLSILGGSEMSIAALQQTLHAAAQCLGEKCNIILGANTSQEYNGCVLVSAVAVKYSDKAKIKPKPKAPALLEVELGNNSEQESSEPQQLELMFVHNTVDRGIFVNSTKVTFNGEDLDIPAFQRREVQVDKGE